MKKSTKPFLLVIVLLLALALASCNKFAGVVSGKKYIVLLVNTEDIRPGQDPKKYCSFSDQIGDIQQYTTDVFPNDTVVWIGVSTSAPLEHQVEITMINHRSGHNILGPPRPVNGKVEGTIKDNATPGHKETYVIHFRVIKPGGPPNSYILDPILRVH